MTLLFTTCLLATYVLIYDCHLGNIKITLFFKRQLQSYFIAEKLREMLWKLDFSHKLHHCKWKAPFVTRDKNFLDLTSRFWSILSCLFLSLKCIESKHCSLQRLCTCVLTIDILTWELQIEPKFDLKWLRI